MIGHVSIIDRRTSQKAHIHHHPLSRQVQGEGVAQEAQPSDHHVYLCEQAASELVLVLVEVPCSDPVYLLALKLIHGDQRH